MPDEGTAEVNLTDFTKSLTGYRPDTEMEAIQYKSANTDVLTLICDAVLPHSLSVEVEAICDAVGYEGAFHISLSPDQMPAFSGGGCLSSRDLSRFGLLFGRKGRDIHGVPFANREFLEETLARKALPVSPPKDWLKYSNHTMNDGRFLGHVGYGGQFLMVDCENNVSCAFLSVLENESGYDDDYMADATRVLRELVSRVALR